MKKVNTLRLCQLALLVAIEIVMSVTPLGFLNLGILSASLLSIPVAIGAIVLGPAESTFLGLVFGAISFYKGFSSASLMTQAMYAASLPASFVTAVIGRVLMGLCTGLLVVAVRKLLKKSTIVDCIVGGLAAPLLNTTFFMGFLMIFFYNTEYIQGLVQSLGIANPILLIFAMVGVQALIEAGVCGVLSTAIGKALKVVLHK